MRQPSEKMRRFLLRPLGRRRISPARPRDLERAFREFQERAEAVDILRQLGECYQDARKNRGSDHWKDPAIARSSIELALAAYFARRMSLQEYVFMVAVAVEGVHDGRLLDKSYPELEQLNVASRRIEDEYGLQQDETGTKAELPPELRGINAEWSALERKRFLETLNELEGGIATNLYQNDRGKFDRLRERGRRSFFHNDNEHLILPLIDTIRRYEGEAKAAAQAGAFTAAVSMLGSAMEGLLLLRCLRSKTKAIKFAKAQPRPARPKDVNNLARWSFDTLIHVCFSAGWLPGIDAPSVSVRPRELAHLLKQMRNQVHPGRAVSDRPWIEAERRDFDDAEMIYGTLYTAIFKGSLLRRLLADAEMRDPV